MKIFISVADDDRPRVEDVALALQGEGHRVFFYRYSLLPGEAFHKQIRDAIEHADIVLYFLTPRSIDPKRYTRTELEIVRSKWAHPRHRVLPIELEPVKMSAVPTYLKQVTFCKPEGNLAASVAYEVAQMEKRLNGMGLLTSSTGRPSAVDSSGSRWVEGMIAGIVLGALAIIVSMMTYELDGALQPLQLNHYGHSAIHGLAMAALLWIGALYFDIRNPTVFAALTAGSVAAFMLDTAISHYLHSRTNFSDAMALVYFGKSLIFAAAAAVALPAFREPQHWLSSCICGAGDRSVCRAARGGLEFGRTVRLGSSGRWARHICLVIFFAVQSRMTIVSARVLEWTVHTRYKMRVGVLRVHVGNVSVGVRAYVQVRAASAEAIRSLFNPIRRHDCSCRPVRRRTRSSAIPIQIPY